MNNNNVGVIYILKNPSFDYIKIGYAGDINDRLMKLNDKTTVPFSYRLYAYYKLEHLKTLTFRAFCDSI